MNISLPGVNFERVKMDLEPMRGAPPPDEAFTRLLSIVLSPGSPIYDTSVPAKRRITRRPDSNPQIKLQGNNSPGPPTLQKV